MTVLAPVMPALPATQTALVKLPETGVLQPPSTVSLPSTAKVPATQALVAY